jgi:curli biogenesis system outer membrane secretion channel CsgG
MDALAILQRLGSGQLLDDLSEALTATAAEVVETGKPGKVTVSFKISNKHQGDVLVMIDETVARVSPKDDPKGAFFFAVNGALHRDDPRQAKMDFRAVDTETGEIREAATVHVERSAR